MTTQDRIQRAIAHGTKTPDSIMRSIRFPSKLHERIVRAALQEHRDFSHQVTWLCEHALKEAAPPANPASPAESTGQ